MTGKEDMAARKPTKSEADILVAQRKVTSEKVRWRREPKSGWRIEFYVVTTDSKPQRLSVRGYVGKKNYSFALLINAFVLRKYTKHGPHRIGGRLFTEPHKHVWDGETELRQAYIPDDIDPESDINMQFCAFCRECNIELNGGYQYVAFQMG